VRPLLRNIVCASLFNRYCSCMAAWGATVDACSEGTLLLGKVFVLGAGLGLALLLLLLLLLLVFKLLKPHRA